MARRVGRGWTVVAGGQYRTEPDADPRWSRPRLAVTGGRAKPPVAPPFPPSLGRGGRGLAGGHEPLVSGL